MVRYEYETSPRKLELEYLPNKKKKTTTKQNNKKNKQVTKKDKKKKEIKNEATKKKTKTVMYILMAFAILITISYRNSLITERFNQLETLKKELNSQKKENDQLAVAIENSLNLKTIEQAAKEKGMQKLTSKQTIYVSLPKKDYVEPSSEKVIMEEEKNIFQIILEKIQTIF